jgi:hypothetical protein
MCTHQTMTNNINTKPTFSSEATQQPTNLFKALDSYLFRELVEYTSCWNLSITCKLLLERKKYVDYKLNRKYSLKYYKDKYFRTKILEKIFNPRKQLYINLNFYGQITNVSILANVYCLKLRCCNKITDVSALRNVKILILSGCKNITNIKELKNVKMLDVSYCNITDDDIIELRKGTIQYLYITDDDIIELRHVYYNIV